MNWDAGCTLMLIDAGPGGRTTIVIATTGRYTGPFSSLVDALKIRLSAPSNKEQNDNSKMAAAAYASGSKVTLVEFCGRQNTALASAREEELNKENLP